MHIRLSLVSLALLALAPAACARGRTASTDTGAGRPDAARFDAGGGLPDAGMIGMDVGSTLPDAASGSPDTGSLSPDTGSLSPDTGGVRDAGSASDAGSARDAALARDAGVDSGACTTAAQCSDGLACNGTERCDLGRCVAGAAVACDDGIPCTVDTCSEPGTCTYTPNDAVCGAGQVCTSTGCRTGTCADSPCRLTPPQCGCAPGQGCYAAGTARVCATAGAGTAGASCLSNANCAAEYECVNFSSGAPASQCTHMCATDAACAGGLCIHTLNDGTGGTIPGLTLCTRPCDPVNQSGCATGLFCNIFQERAGAMRIHTDCTGPAGPGTQFTPCATDAECAPGYGCINTGAGLECSHWCRIASPTCPLGGTCTGFTTPIIAGGIEYGVCI